MAHRIKAVIAPEKAEMRKIFADVMGSLAGADKRVIYMDCDLSNSIGMAAFMKEFPDQSVNCGIMEANMIGVASGMSSVGLIPFVHTFGTFASRRVMDQVFVSAAYAKQNVRIIGSDPGVTASMNGGTHMPFEDIGMMRTVPGVTIIEPTDSVMLADMMRQTKDRQGVFYIRLSRKVAVGVYEAGSDFEIGRAVPLREGKDVTIFAAGIGVADSLEAAGMLADEGIDCAVVDMFTIKPLDTSAVLTAAEQTGAIVTVENHNVIGGLGSAVAEALCDTVPVPLERIGAQDVFGEVGTVDWLKKRFGMTPEHIAAAARRAIGRKGPQRV
ncbi:MAG: transketolase family protein [Clostridiales Family XIII bacterium]|jgi:transketolase|nr:transketolase family protein [Clostridiales Family XIII bacterium]